MNWQQDLADELHGPVRRNFTRRRVYSNGIDEIWAADLVEMQKFSKWNRGVRYLLMVIDVFSKFGWIEPLHDKKGETIVKALNNILRTGRKPKRLWTDKGKEFYNKQFRDLLEEYVDKLPALLKNYNETKHSSIRMTPIQASQKRNENTVYLNLYGKETLSSPRPKFKVGDSVRISKYKRKVFDKGYTLNWTEEIFVIDEIQYTSPPTYKIRDLNGEEIQGSFYEPELLLAKQEVFRIEKVLRRDNKNGRALVKWSGYPDKFNSWVPLSDLEKIS